MKSNDNPCKLYDDLYIDENELNNNFYIINNIEDEYIEEYFDIEQSDYNENLYYRCNCINCFYSDGKYCQCKNIYIDRLSPICWFYKDCFTMRTNSDFQDDNDCFE